MTELMIGGVIEAPDERRSTTTAKTLVFTCAQNNTRLHDGFFGALLGYCKYREAELHISRFTYNKAAYGTKSVKPGSKRGSDDDELWYDERILPYVSDEAIQVCDDLVWCGELNIIPTRKLPLSTLTTYTRQASAIVPHVKMHMNSVPVMKGKPTKFLYSTGAVTQRNYIQKVAGQEADFHHVFGALVVEIDDTGTWWARQINSDKSGGFFDLTSYYSPYDGARSELGYVHAITHGDIHYGKHDQSVLDSVFHNLDCVVEQLKPREQFFHDLLDFTARNHHEMKKWRSMQRYYKKGIYDVKQEISEAASFLYTVLACSNPGSKVFVVESNHDAAIEWWLDNRAVLDDPINVEYWLWLNWQLAAMPENKGHTSAFKLALEEMLSKIDGAYQSDYQMLCEDDSYLILGEIEAGLHGHLGPNGARGNPKNLRTVGKANTGHTHSAGIVDGVYTAGVYGKLDMGYNRGLSSWSHSMVVTYPNAKRAILTLKDGKAWR